MNTRRLVTPSLAAIVIAAAGLWTIEPASAGFGMGRGSGGHGMGMARGFGGSQMGMSRGFGGSGMGMNRMGMSRMGSSHSAGASHIGRGVGSSSHSHVGKSAHSAGSRAAMRGDRPVGGKMFEKAGTGKAPQGSTTYDGKSIEVHKNGDGTKTVSVTGKDGNTTTTVKGKPPANAKGASVDDGKGGWKPYEHAPKQPSGGSTTYGGTTTTTTNTGKGEQTVTKTDASGKTTTEVHGKPPANAKGASVDDGKGGYKPYEPTKAPIGGSTTFDGKTTTVDKTPKVNQVIDTKVGPITISGGNITSSTLGSKPTVITPPM